MAIQFQEPYICTNKKLMSFLHILKSSLSHKCPRCLEGDLFPDKNSYHLKHTAEMYSHCPKCNLNFSPEPGYFYGAMYVSYAFTIAIGVGIFLLYYFVVPTFDSLPFLIILTIILLILAPYTFRTSRAIWLNLFHRYDPNMNAKVTEK